MRRRRTPKPSPSKDWRAIAVDRPQRTLALPVRTSADTAPDAPAEPDGADVRLRRDNGDPRVTLADVPSVYRDADEVRRFAARLCAAAGAMKRTR